MATHKISVEEDYKSKGGSRNLGSIGIEDVEIEVDEEYEFLQERPPAQLKFIFRKLQQIEKRLDELEGN